MYLRERYLVEYTRLLYGPFAAVYGVVLVAVLLYGHVGQVDEHVVEFVGALGVLHGAEAAEAQAVGVALQRPVRRHQHVPACVRVLRLVVKHRIEIKMSLRQHSDQGSSLNLGEPYFLI